MRFDDRFALGLIRLAADKGEVYVDETRRVTIHDQMAARALAYTDLLAILRSARHAFESGDGHYLVDGPDTDATRRELEVRLYRGSGGGHVVVVHVLR